MAITSKGYLLTGAAQVILPSHPNRLCTVLQNKSASDLEIEIALPADTPTFTSPITLVADEKFTFPTPIGQTLWAKGVLNDILVVLTNDQE